MNYCNGMIKTYNFSRAFFVVCKTSDSYGFIISTFETEEEALHECKEEKKNGKWRKPENITVLKFKCEGERKCIK